MTIYRADSGANPERADVILHLSRNTEPPVRLTNPAGSSIGTVTIGIGKFEANVSYYELVEAILLTSSGRAAVEFMMIKEGDD